MNLGHYLALEQQVQRQLAAGFRQVRTVHPDETEVYHQVQRFAGQCDHAVAALAPHLEEYPVADGLDPTPSAGFSGGHSGSLGLLRDLQELYLMTAEGDLAWTLLDRAGQGARDAGLLTTVRQSQPVTRQQLAWLRTQLTQAATQTLVVA